MTAQIKSKHSIIHAFDGLAWAVKTQPNYRVHLAISIATVILSVLLNISSTEWLFVVMTITLGLVIEAFNTAIEATTDAITREWKAEIKIAKDVSAGAMLTYAIGAIVLAVLIFLPKLLLII